MSEPELPDELWSNAIEDWNDLVVVGDDVGVLRRGEIARFAREDGSYGGGRSLGNDFAAYADGEALLAKDHAGDLYIAAISTAEATASEVPMPSAVGAGSEPAEVPERYHLHVTKYDEATQSVVWRRSVIWSDRLAHPDTSTSLDGGLRLSSLAVTSDGLSWVLGSATAADVPRQFLVGIDATGEIVAARWLSTAQLARFVRAASDGVPFVAGTFRDWPYGMGTIEGAGAYVERNQFE